MSWHKIIVALASATVCSAFAEDSVQWPSNFDSALVAHVAALEPSGGQKGESTAYAAFDSAVDIRFVEMLETLRNFRLTGFMVLLR